MKKKPWEWSEEEAAKEAGSLVPFSGSLSFKKLDIDGENEYSDFMIENKYRDGDTFTINIKKFQEWERQALTSTNKRFILRLDFGGRILKVVSDKVFKGFISEESS